MKYNITKVDYREGNVWLLTAVGLHDVHTIGRFGTRELARQRVKDLKVVAGTLQKTYVSVNTKTSYDAYRLKLIELGIPFNTARSDDTDIADFEYIILIPAISKEDFKTLMEEIR